MKIRNLFSEWSNIHIFCYLSIRSNEFLSILNVLFFVVRSMTTVLIKRKNDFNQFWNFFFFSPFLVDSIFFNRLQPKSVDEFVSRWNLVLVVHNLLISSTLWDMNVHTPITCRMTDSLRVTTDWKYHMQMIQRYFVIHFIECSDASNSFDIIEYTCHYRRSNSIFFKASSVDCKLNSIWVCHAVIDTFNLNYREYKKIRSVKYVKIILKNVVHVIEKIHFESSQLQRTMEKIVQEIRK